MTPSGIEPATFRFVAQHLNHCANAVPRGEAIIITYYEHVFVALVIRFYNIFAHYHMNGTTFKTKQQQQKMQNIKCVF